MKLDARWIKSLSIAKSNKWLSHLSASERLWLARALCDLEDELSLKLGSALVKDLDPKVRAEVALGLGEIGYRTLTYAAGSLGTKTLLNLRTLAQDSAWEVRANVPCAALQFGSESVMPIVQGLTSDSVDSVKQIALDCFGDLAALHPNTAARLLISPHDLGARLAVSGSPSLGRFWAQRPKSARASPRIGLQLLGTPSSYVDVSTNNRDTAKPGESHAATRSATDAAPTSISAARNVADKGAGSGGDGDGGGGTDDGGVPGDEPQYLDLPGGSRYVNSWFVGHADPQRPLEFQREYELGIEIAPQPRVGTFTAGDPKFKEPPFEGAETIEITVAIVSDDFSIPGKAARRMKLPRDPTKRSEEISFMVTPHNNNKEVFINVFFYYQNNLFHEALIGARVQVMKRQSAEVTTAPLTPVTRYQAPVQGPRDLNLQVIELGGSYRLVMFYDFGGTDFDIFSCTIEVNRDKLIDLLASVRQDLVDIVNTESQLPSGAKKKVFFDGEPGAVPTAEGRLPNMFRIENDVYGEVLQRLARAGSHLYVNLFESGTASTAMAQRAPKFGQKLRELSARRQPLRMQVLSDEFFIPWNLLFDGQFPVESIDPSQFWGFRHLIEEVPGSSRAERIEAVVPVSDSAIPIALNVNINAIPQVLTGPHRKSFRDWGGRTVAPIERTTENQVLEALQGKKQQGAIEYFYCHAGVAGTSRNHFDQSYLGLTSSEGGLTLEDIKIATTGRTFDSKPVVFLNACESGRMDGRFYDGFVPRFLKMGARVVLGSDCDVPSLFGAHFGTHFMEALLKGDPVGAALLAQRRKLLENYQNPLGLIYRVFGNADTRFSKALI